MVAGLAVASTAASSDGRVNVQPQRVLSADSVLALKIPGRGGVRSKAEVDAAGHLVFTSPHKVDTPATVSERDKR